MPLPIYYVIHVLIGKAEIDSFVDNEFMQFEIWIRITVFSGLFQISIYRLHPKILHLGPLSCSDSHDPISDKNSGYWLYQYDHSALCQH